MELTLGTYPMRNDGYILDLKLVGKLPCPPRYLALQVFPDAPFTAIIYWPPLIYTDPLPRNSILSSIVDYIDKSSNTSFVTFSLPIQRRIEEPFVFIHFDIDHPVTIRLPKKFWPWRLRFWWAFSFLFSFYDIMKKY